MVITCSKRKDQPGKIVNPACGQLNRENVFPPVPVSRLRIWYHGTGSAVPSRSILRLNLVLTYGIPPDFLGGVYLFILSRYYSCRSIHYKLTLWRRGGFVDIFLLKGKTYIDRPK